MTRPVASGLPIEGQPSQGPNVILYLPSGPLFKKPGDSSHSQTSESYDPKALCSDDESQLSATESPQHVLASQASATVVTVNYRLGPAATLPDQSILNRDQNLSARKIKASSYKYPTPIHDTLAGFDWLQNTFKPAQLGIFGSHIGGSLALMLALTEAQYVHAVAAMEPVCDWPGLDDYCAMECTQPEMNRDTSREHDQVSPNKAPNRRNKGKTPRTRSPPDLVPLLAAREQFFSSPERCFDAFASPILFLRSPGRDVPKAFPKYLTGSEYPVPTVKAPRGKTSAEQYSVPDGSLWDRDIYPGFDAYQSGSSEYATPAIRRRKALSRWPPYGLDSGASGRTWSGPGHVIGRLQVTLPWVRVFLSRGDVPVGLADAGSSRSAKKLKYGGNGTTVLARQGGEMVSVMRRACFWGREEGFGDRRVTVACFDGDACVEGGSWLRSMFQVSVDED